MSLTAVVLAGGPSDDLAALTPGAANKAFVSIGGVPLVKRTLQALRATPGIGRIIVVAPPQTHAEPALALADECRADGRKIRESLANGLAGLPPDQDVLISASDLPILTTVAISDFVARATAANADLTYGCVEKRTHMARFPDVPHTWARLRDGTYCGGGFITIKPRIFPALSNFIEQLGHARKNPLQLASLFGWDVLLKFAVGRLTISDAEARASRILHAPVRAVVSPYAETAVNVDRISDVELAEKLIATRERVG
ncbi:MAG: NTP transferase domain-containing protein [Vulcanimicrobiaceae bacterium]